MAAAAAYKHRVRLLRQAQDVDDGAGNVLRAWGTPVLLGRRRVAFKPTDGREDMEAGRLESTISGIVTLRADAVTLALTAADRIEFEDRPYGGRMFDIEAVVPASDGTEITVTVAERKD